MPRSRVPIKGSIGKSILTGQKQTVVQQTIVQQITKGATSGVGGTAATIWPLISQIPVNVSDLAALATPGLVVDTGSNIIARTLAVNAPLTIADPTGAAGNPTISLTTAALTKTDDTNVTLTLGGTPAGALVEAVSLTLGWTGQLAVPRGGSGAATLTGYLVGNGTSPFTAVSDIPAADVSGLATVATTGAYSDLTGTPTIPADISELTYITGNDETADAPNSLQILAGTNITFDTSTPNQLTVNATGGGGGSGTVTSVDVSVPSILTISGNPITTAGTLAFDLATQNANLVLAGPTTGSAATPTFRSLVIADIPTIPAAHTSGFAPVATTGAYSDLSGTPSLAAIATSGSASDLASGTVPSARLPTASTSVLGAVKVDGTSITISGGVISSTGGASGHNPTASVGLTAINGTATTFLRSDGAPALDQGISPTWTGAHTWAPSSGGIPLTVNGPIGNWGQQVIGSSTTNNSYGLLIFAGTTYSDAAFNVSNQTGSTVFFDIRGDGSISGHGPVAGALVDMTPDASSFTGTLTGMTATITNTCRWSRNGNQVTLVIGNAVGTSNANTLTMTGLPAAIQPAHTQLLSVAIEAMESASALVVNVGATVTASSGAVTFSLNGSATGWGSSLGKGVASDFTVTYLLN